jgi:hypothetical protein
LIPQPYAFSVMPQPITGSMAAYGTELVERS